MAEKRKAPEGDTKLRILDAAERLYVAHGADGVSLRPVTAAAGANIAAVHYHFGNRENLLRAVLARRLDPLNDARDRLLDACEARWAATRPGDPALSCEHVLAALLVPALLQARQAGEAGFERMRFLGRVYSDASPFTVALLRERYASTQHRFLDAFARILPELSLADLRLRLSFVMKAVAGVVAGNGLREVLVAFGRGDGTVEAADVEILASLGNLMAGALTAPARTDTRLRLFGEVVALAERRAKPESVSGIEVSLKMDAAE